MYNRIEKSDFSMSKKCKKFLLPPFNFIIHIVKAKLLPREKNRSLIKLSVNSLFSKLNRFHFLVTKTLHNKTFFEISL